jgi:hypothetical protein
MTEPELKPILPCPFCGEQPDIYKKVFWSEDQKPQFFIECLSCERAKINEGWFDVNLAIESWNKRHQDEKYKKAIEFLHSINIDGEHPIRKLLRELGELE